MNHVTVDKVGQIFIINGISFMINKRITRFSHSNNVLEIYLSKKLLN